MRIDIQKLIAVLSVAAILIPNRCASTSSRLEPSIHRRPGKSRDKYFGRSAGGVVDAEVGEFRGMPTHQEKVKAIECCPSKLEMVEPEGGKNEEDMYVELYRDGEIRQRFYELSCLEGVFDKPCHFLDRKLYNQSRCAQRYSFTYALVRDVDSRSGWKMDYIKVRSGCSCEVTPKLKKKRNSKTKKNKSSKRQLFEFDEDEV